MKKEQIQENGISRRGFLKRTALAGAAICIAPALEKVTATAMYMYFLRAMPRP